MKFIRLKTIALSLVTAMFFTGCASLQKMKKNAGLIQFKTTPEILETHAGKVDVAIDGKFPSKYFIKKATLVATPVLTH